MARRIAGSAKVTRPRVGYGYPRERLFDRLNRARRGAVWVGAPAGAGKTTLAVTYVQAFAVNALWYQLDRGDSDPASFFHHLGLAAKQAAPRARWKLPHLTPEYVLGLPTFSRHFFGELYARLKSPALLIFDNQQELEEKSPVHALLVDAIASVPPGARIIVISREDPPAEFARLRASGTLECMGWDDLRLTEVEALEIARRLHVGPLDAAAERRVLEAVQSAAGWAAGLVLLLEASRASAGGGAADGLSRDRLFDYFASQVFDRAEPATRELLSISALLPEMSVAALERLAGDAHVDRRLREFFRRNYFVTRVADKPPTYQYHSLFREFLLERGAGGWPPARRAALSRDAALALLEGGQGAAAIELLLSAEAWSDAVREILNLAPEIAAQGRFQVLHGWLKSIPQCVLAGDAWLQYWLASALAGTDPARALQCLEAAYEGFSRSNDPAGLYLAFADAVQITWMSRFDLAEMDVWLDRFAEIDGRHGVIPTIETEARALTSVLMGCYMRRLGDPRIPAWLERSRRMLDEIPNPALRGALLASIGWHYFCGRGAYRAWLRQLSTLIQAGQRDDPPLYGLYLRLSAAFGFIYAGEFADAVREADAGLELAQAAGVHVLDSLLLGARIQAVLCLGDLDAADAGFARMAVALAALPNGMGGSYERCMRSWRRLLDPDGVSEAIELGREAVEYATRAGALYAIAGSRYVLAHALLTSGQTEEGRRWLALSRIRWTDGEHENLAYQAELTEAWARLEGGERDAALEILRRALLRGETLGYGAPVMTRPAFLYPVLELALLTGTCVDFARQLVRQAALVPPSAADLPDDWPVPVRIRTFGTFEVLLDGARLEPGPLQRRRPLELLQALIALGGRSVTQARLAEALWPDAPGDRAITSLHTTLHRLRKLLRREDAVTLKEGRLSLNERVVWTDVRAAEALFDRLEAALEDPPGDPLELRALEQRLIALYRGRFLESEPDQAWALRPQEELHERAVGALVTLGRHWQRADDHERALDAYRRALKLDPLSEPLHRELMQAHADGGELAEAIIVYERCRKVLSISFGVPPSPATTALYQAIRGQVTLR